MQIHMNLKIDESIIKYPKDLSKDLISKSILLPMWSQQLDENIKINAVDIITADIFPGNRIGFFEANINYTSNSHNDTSRIMMSGGSASIVVLIRCTQTNEIHTVLVRQPRIGSGQLIYEYPAGLTDDSTDFRLTAVRELEEECGIIASVDEVININDLVYEKNLKFYTNAQMFYEEASVFLVVKKMSIEEIKAIEGRNGGVDEEEQITLHVSLFNDVINLTPDPATISITFLLQKLIKEGKITI